MSVDLHIDMDAVADNVRHLSAAAGGRLMAVVKADGFGMGGAGTGGAEVGRVALQHGATSLGVG